MRILSLWGREWGRLRGTRHRRRDKKQNAKKADPSEGRMQQDAAGRSRTQQDAEASHSSVARRRGHVIHMRTSTLAPGMLKRTSLRASCGQGCGQMSRPYIQAQIRCPSSPPAQCAQRCPPCRHSHSPGENSQARQRAGSGWYQVSSILQTLNTSPTAQPYRVAAHGRTSLGASSFSRSVHVQRPAPAMLTSPAAKSPRRPRNRCSAQTTLLLDLHSLMLQSSSPWEEE